MNDPKALRRRSPVQADHEKLEVHGLAIEAIRALDRVRGAILRSRPDLRDELARASASIALNVAAGASGSSAAEKARFHRMSRRSCAECMAILDVAAPDLSSRRPAREAKRMLLRVTAMLTRMVHAMTDRK